jgi:hypothetical protein
MEDPGKSGAYEFCFLGEFTTDRSSFVADNSPTCKEAAGSMGCHAFDLLGYPEPNREHDDRQPHRGR